MTKKVGRNDLCPCGSGKKYKKCCELQGAAKRKIQATLLSGHTPSGSTLKDRATQISANFFSKSAPPVPSETEEGEARHPPEADRPM